jgi:hypothetical protein
MLQKNNLTRKNTMILVIAPNNTILILFLFLILASCNKSSDPVAAEPEVKLTGILSSLQKAHPRLLLTDARLQELKTLSLTDARLKKYADAGEKSKLGAPDTEMWLATTYNNNHYSTAFRLEIKTLIP